MKTKSLLMLLLFSMIFFSSCQEEVMEIVQPKEEETLVANSKLTTLIGNTSAKDGSKDNILDKSSCLTVELPVTVNVNGLDIIIDSEEDFEVIEAIFDQFEEDDDILNFIFPIKIILSDYTVIEITNEDELEELVETCAGENVEDDDIECVDFNYPISFSTYNSQFQIIDVVTIENDEQLHYFIEQVEEGEVFASLNFPVEMILASGDVVEVQNNAQLEEVIDAAKDACDEDDDNDYGDDDFTKERLDNLLMSCPWVVHEMERGGQYMNHRVEYFVQFKEEGVVKVRTREGDLISGTWESEITTDGAKVVLEIEGLEDFTLDWIVYELEDDRIKFHKEGDNRIILKKNCNVQVDFTPEMIQGYLQECLWRITELSVNGVDHEMNYIGTPLKFFDNNVVKIRVNGEYLEGTYSLVQNNLGNILTIQLEGRPNLQLEWVVTFLHGGLMKLENQNSTMVMQWLCPNTDGDVEWVEDILLDGQWIVAAYEAESEITTESFYGYTLDFFENGKILVTDPNYGESRGSWLAYRKEGLKLGLNFGDAAPFGELNYRWTLKEISEHRMELKEYNANGEVVRVVVLERKVDLGLTVEQVQANLVECLWRVSELYVDEVHKENAYIGLPFEFMENSGVMLRVKGEWIQGAYELFSLNEEIYLQIFFDDRPELSIMWKLKYLEGGEMKLENDQNEFTLKQSCQENDGDVMEIFNFLAANTWKVAGYESTPATDITTSSFEGYTIAFLENGRIEVTNPNQVVSETGSWLNYRYEGLYLDMAYGDSYPFAVLTNNWKIIEINGNTIYLKVFSDSSNEEQVVALQIAS